jgi:hypothetical protein
MELNAAFIEQLKLGMKDFETSETQLSETIEIVQKIQKEIDGIPPDDINSEKFIKFRSAFRVLVNQHVHSIE